MGSEQSAHSTIQRGGSLGKGEQKQSNIRRQHTIANPGGGGGAPEDSPENGGRPGSISPGPSVCSDIDLPYISYTVNRPIGDSPKLTNKQLVKSRSTSSRRIQPRVSKAKSNAHNIVVVRGASGNSSTPEKDPDVLRLQGIPMFLPIMRATLSLPAARDPEVLERLNPTPFRNLCLRYQHHLTVAANLVATEQNQITHRTREIDGEIVRICTAATDRRRKFAKYAERLGGVQDLSHQLNRCHALLNQILESMETLNGYLDIEDRLEPFVWTTG